MKRVVLEKSVEDYLVERVTALGGYAPKVDVRGKRGQVDRVVTLPYRPWQAPRLAYTSLVEVKAPGERPRPEQMREHERLRALGFHVRVLDSHLAVDEFLRPFESH